MTPRRTLSRRSAIRRACLTGELPRYLADLMPVRGKCRHGRCKGRWAHVRVTLDFRFESVERYAVSECSSCGRVWRRVRVPALRSPAGYQAVLFTIIVPARFRRWHSRGRWHREGDDAAVIRNADLGDVDEAARNHRKRADRLSDLRAARKAKREAAIAAEHERTMTWLARMAEREAERKAEEAAAAAREA